MNRGWILFALALVVTAAAAPFLGGDGGEKDQPEVDRNRSRIVSSSRPGTRATTARRNAIMDYRADAVDRGDRRAPVRQLAPNADVRAAPPELTVDGPRQPRPRNPKTTTTNARPTEKDLEARLEAQQKRRDAIRRQQEEAAERRAEALARRTQNDRRRSLPARPIPSTSTTITRGGSLNRVPAVSTVTAPTMTNLTGVAQTGARSQATNNLINQQIRDTLGTNSNASSSSGNGLPQEVTDRLNEFFGTNNFNFGGTGSTGSTGGDGTDDGLTTTTGGGGNLTGSTGEQVGTIGASARWIPVDNSNCAEELASWRTNDLYIRAQSPFRLVSAQLGGTANDGLTVAGGAFFQHAAGTNMAPAATAIRTEPCLAFDSYLAIGEAGIAFVPTPVAPDPADWGTLVQAGWFTIETELSQQSEGLFGDAAHYVHVGRFTAPSTLTDASGEISVTVEVDGEQIPLVIPIAFCEDCWSEDLFGVGPSTEMEGTGGGGDDDDDAVEGGDGDDDGDGMDDGDDGSDEGDGGDMDGDDGDDDGSADDGDDDQDEDPANDEEGDGEEEEEEGDDDDRVTAVWVAINNTCDDDGDGTSDLAGLTTADLYVRTDGPHSILSAVSGPTLGNNDGISIFGGSFWQHPLGFNVAATQAQVSAFPCLAFDSWLSIGAFQPSFLFEPDTADWGTTLETLWFVTGESATAQLNAPVADGAYYIRLGRFTVPQGTSVLGEIEVGFRFADQGSSQTIKLTVPDILSAN